MAILCKLFGHKWDWYTINPHKDEDYGYQAVCTRCETIGPKQRPPGFEEDEPVELEWEIS